MSPVVGIKQPVIASWVCSWLDFNQVQTYEMITAQCHLHCITGRQHKPTDKLLHQHKVIHVLVKATCQTFKQRGVVKKCIVFPDYCSLHSACSWLELNTTAAAERNMETSRYGFGSLQTVHINTVLHKITSTDFSVKVYTGVLRDFSDADAVMTSAK